MTVLPSITDGKRPIRAKLMAAAILPLLAGGCSGILPTSGPSAREVQASVDQKGGTAQAVVVIDVTNELAQSLLDARYHEQLSDAAGGSSGVRYVVGRGDTLAISIWEAPPAVLFASPAGVPTDGTVLSAPTRANELPAQMVSADGMIMVPFIGTVMAAGRSTREVEADIARRLKGKANQPQVLVRIADNTSSQVTIVGEVKSSARMPLTPRGERVLDALATAGGPNQPVNKSTVRLTRADRSYAMPLEAVIDDPRQNVLLRAGDVLTVLYQPLSFTALGATGKNEEINFEAGGITLAQALARTGGVQDARADATGVFIFRFEDPLLLKGGAVTANRTREAGIPVVYRVNLKEPASFFVAQRFPIKDKDVLYVANAPTAELQKFLNIVLSGAYPILNIINMTR